MGSCASVHKGTSESAMKLGLSFGSKSDKLVILESPIKDKPVTAPTPSVKTFEDYGSKDETFFDSQPWLDSDCDDDFYSVRGDFTPSRGNTPVHHNFSAGNSHVNKMPSVEKHPNSAIEPSPTGRKKKLSELFRESLGGDREFGALPNSANQNLTVKSVILDLPPKSDNDTPYKSGNNSVCSSERTVNGDAQLEKDKSIKSVQCCLPSLISCHSFSERKKRMSPAVAVNGKA